jgi:hypothetical protein
MTLATVQTTLKFCLKTAALLAVPLAAALQVCEAQSPGQMTFASPEEASRALFAAVEDRDTGLLQQILGKQDELLSSSDPGLDEADRQQFVLKYRQMHRLAALSDSQKILYIGAENWPFPVPLVLRNGAWSYDTDAGVQDVLYRRHGENELAAIEACEAVAGSLQKPSAEAGSDNQTDAVLVAARSEQQALGSHGYSFRIRSNPRDGKPEVVAFPVVYGSSGVMTFLVTAAGSVYQKDLGVSTATLVAKMTGYGTDATWILVRRD